MLTINGARHALWRAVEPHENRLDRLVQRRRHTHAATPCFRTLLTGCPSVPRVILTATLQSDGAATRARDGQGWTTASVARARTGVRMHIGRPASGNAACRAAPPLSMPRDLWLRMDL